MAFGVHPLGAPLVALVLLFVPIRGVAQGRSWRNRLPARQLAQRLRSGAPAARVAAARVLGRRGARESVSVALAAATERGRRPLLTQALLDSLARRPDPRHVPRLASALSSPNDIVRQRAALALAAVGDDAALDALVSGLGDARSAEAAQRGLLRAGDAAVSRLIAALRVGPAGARAAEVLGVFSERLDVGVRVRAALGQAGDSQDSVLRAAALVALAPVAVPRDEPLYLRALADESTAVVAAALSGLARVASRRAWPALTAALEGAGDSDRPAVLRAMLRSDPMAAVARVLLLWSSESPVEHAQALDVALRAADAAFLELYEQAWATGLRRAELGSLLIALPDAAGLPILLRSDAPEAARELAVALRDPVPRASRMAALARIAAQPPARAFTLRALARDLTLLPAVRAAVGDDDAAVRVRAARAAGLLGDERALPWLSQALAHESSDLAFRAIARALVDLGGDAPAEQLSRWLEDPATAPEAMALAVKAPQAPLDRGLRRSLRRALRAGPARSRAGAARALALLGDTHARPALLAALDDGRPEVRLAAASALRALGQGPSPSRTLAGFARAELDQGVHARLVEIESSPRPFDGTGDAVLRVTFIHHGDGPHGALTADVLLVDGRWLRVAADGQGELFLADLAPGEADVRLALIPPTD